MTQALDCVRAYFYLPGTLTGRVRERDNERQSPELIRLLANSPEDTARRPPCTDALCQSAIRGLPSIPKISDAARATTPPMRCAMMMASLTR